MVVEAVGMVVHERELPVLKPVWVHDTIGLLLS